MRRLIFILGILTGLAFSRIPHYLDEYAAHSLPAAYAGPKHHVYANGERIS